METQGGGESPVIPESTDLCPCNESLSYADCCKPYHDKVATPDTAEQLMRSRYTAFVQQKVDYIVATTVPVQQAFLDKNAIAEWAKTTDWAGLEVINHNPKLDKNHASVEFKAFFKALKNGEIQQNFHHELSFFVKVVQNQISKWYFLDPTVSMKLSQKQPCICGSGEKFKRCCGKFI